VAASSVVVLQPGGKGSGSLVVAGEDLPVGQFGGQGAVESFDLSRSARAVGLDEDLFGAEYDAGFEEGVAVGPGVCRS